MNTKPSLPVLNASANNPKTVWEGIMFANSVLGKAIFDAADGINLGSYDRKDFENREDLTIRFFYSEQDRLDKRVAKVECIAFLRAKFGFCLADGKANAEALMIAMKPFGFHF